MYETEFCNFLFQKLLHRNALALFFLTEIEHFYQKAVLHTDEGDEIYETADHVTAVPEPLPCL